MPMKRPNNRRNLDMAIRRVTDSEKEFVRYRTTMANAVVGQMLPGGVVKGGAALKLRYGNASTRFTTDFDAARVKGVDAFVDDLDEKLAEGWEGFTGRVVPRKPPSPDGIPMAYVMQPYDIKMAYLSRAWCTVPLEVGHNEIGDADEPEWAISPEIVAMFTQLGFPEPGPVPLMPLCHQVAQKLHALSGSGSDRAHDLVDLQLMMQNSQFDLVKIRETCERLFSYRQAHEWPCAIKRGPNWAGLYHDAAEGLPVIQDVDEAVEWGNALVERIAAS